jgi:hypothetical protein
MKPKTLLIAAVVAALAPLPALAADPSCAIQRTTPEYRAELANAMTTGDEAARGRLEATLNEAVKSCADQAGYNDEQGSAYFDIVLSEISRSWLIPELAKAGLANTVIDKALDFGPGRANPTLENDISEAQIGAIISAYIDAKVEIEKVPQQAWEQVGAYAAATAIYWQAIGKLP